MGLALLLITDYRKRSLRTWKITENCPSLCHLNRQSSAHLLRVHCQSARNSSSPERMDPMLRITQTAEFALRRCFCKISLKQRKVLGNARQSNSQALHGVLWKEREAYLGQREHISKLTCLWKYPVHLQNGTWVRKKKQSKAEMAWFVCRTNVTCVMSLSAVLFFFFFSLYVKYSSETLTQKNSERFVCSMVEF